MAILFLPMQFIFFSILFTFFQQFGFVKFLIKKNPQNFNEKFQWNDYDEFAHLKPRQ